METLTSGFELEVRDGDIPIDYNKAFYRLAARLDASFPRLPIRVLLDGLLPPMAR